MTRATVVVHEEHHEAFFIWEYAAREGLIPGSGNTVLHVDWHADMSLPALWSPLPGSDAPLEELARFAYENLTCGSFLHPLLHRGLVGRVLWLKPLGSASAEEVRYVRSYDGAGRFLVSGRARADGDGPAPASQDRREYGFRAVALDTDLTDGAATILDIDLDFFSCETFIPLARRIEITEAEYRRITGDDYHFARVTLNARPVREEGRWFLDFNPWAGQALTTPARLTKMEALDRVGKLQAFLKRNSVRPSLIGVCRSRLSGYTPEDQWEFLEHVVLDLLAELYAPAVVPIERILPSVRRPGPGRAHP